MAPATQSPEFQKAVEESRKLKQTPTNDEMLDLYSLFKQGTQDPPFSEAQAPAMYELKAKAKYNAWKKVADRDLSPEDAQKEYVQKVEELKNKYGMSE